MNVFGELVRAQMELLAADPSAGIKGRFIYNTVSDLMKLDNGTIYLTMVDLATAQTLTNKTLSGASIQAPIRLDAKQDTLANLITYAATAANGQFVYATDTKDYYSVVDNILVELGGGSSGSGINYILNPNAEVDTDGYAVFNDGVVAKPIDGTGGSANVTFTRNTTAPLRGDADFVFTKDAVNRQGQGASYDFTIDKADQAKVLVISFDADTSTNYADNDLGVYIYDVTNAQIIEPSPKDLLAGVNGKFNVEFQTASDSVSYRLIWHVQSVNALAYTVNMDNIIVGPNAKSYGSPITDWESFTPIVSGLGAGAISTANGSFRRVGDSVEFRVELQKDGTPGSGGTVVTMNLPDGLSADLTKGIPSAPRNILGVASFNSLIDTIYNIELSDAFSVRFTTGSVSFQGNDYTAGAIIRANGTIPIQGWGSTVQMSDVDSGRITAVRYTLPSSDAVIIGNRVDYDVEDYNTGQIQITTGASWQALINTSGFYEITAAALTNAVAAGVADQFFAIDCHLNGGRIATLGADYASSTATRHYMCGATITKYLNAGDIIDFRYNESLPAVNLVASGDNNYMEIKKVQGPNQVAASETVAARVTSSSGQSIPHSIFTALALGTVDFDTHGSMSGAGVFTTPISGKYKAIGSGLFDTIAWAINIAFELRVYVNGVAVTSIAYDTTDAALTKFVLVRGEELIDLNQGDTVDIRIFQNSGSNKTLITNSLYNYFSINRVGV